MMRPEPTTELTMTDRELLEYIAQQLARLEPLISLIESPPPMLAAMVPGLGMDGE
jgi:hypothetical protein